MKPEGRTRIPSPSLIVGVLALCVALGGVATALPGRNSVQSNDIQRNAVKSKHIKNGVVNRKDQKPNQRTDWALIDLSAGDIIRQSGGISITNSAESQAYVDFGRSVAGRAIVATPQFNTFGEVNVALCGGTLGSGAGAEAVFCVPGGTNNTRHVFVNLDPNDSNDDVYLALLPK